MDRVGGRLEGVDGCGGGSGEAEFSARHVHDVYSNCCC